MRIITRQNMPIRMLKLLEEHQPELLFCEMRIDQCEHDGVEREVPCREPWVFPFVGHRQNAHRVEMAPVTIATVMAGGGRLPIWIVAVKPRVDVEQIALLGPQQTGECLT